MKKDNDDKQKKGRPKNNQAQNRQVRDAETLITLSTDKVLGEKFKRTIERLSREMGANLGFKDLIEIGTRIKNKETIDYGKYKIIETTSDK